MSEENVKMVLAKPWVSVGSDAGAGATTGILSQEKTHPRAWGSFPRILGKYVREENVLTLEAAIKKMTSLPAGRVKLEKRGELKEGYFADITIFDPEKVKDVSTYENPNQRSEGIHFVLVNGKIVLDQGEITSERPGKVLRGPGYKRGFNK
jgi:N-acyl-D-aspartate/D-glutamate deacylase